MTATTETIALVECPKCLGRGYFDCYAGIDGGRCFRCAGSGWVKPIAARKATWSPRPDTRPAGTEVVLEGFGRAVIRPGTDAFTGLWSITTATPVGELVTWFGVRNGRVFVESMCCGHENAFAQGDGFVASESERKARTLARQLARTVLQAAWDARSH